MKFQFYIRSCVWRFCAVVCLAATASPVDARNQPPPLLLELKASGGEMQVFEGGTVVESRRGKKTQRQLSADQLRKLHQVIVSNPCEQQWLRPQPETGYIGDDCLSIYLSYVPPVLQEVQIIRHYAGHQGSVVMYVPCDGSKVRDKKAALRSSQRWINRNWQRFLSDVDAALGGKSILKGCNR